LGVGLALAWAVLVNVAKAIKIAGSNHDDLEL
jgi:hypothetical protein